MSYSIMDQQQVWSPFTGRGTGMRHAGGGSMNPKMGKSMGSPYGMNPMTAGFQLGAYSPQPGSLSDLASRQRDAWNTDTSAQQGAKK